MMPNSTTGMSTGQDLQIARAVDQRRLVQLLGNAAK